MKLDKLFQSLLLTGAVVVLISTPARSEVNQGESSTGAVGESTFKDTLGVRNSKSPVLTASNRKHRDFPSQVASSLQRAKSEKLNRKILQLSQTSQVSQSAESLVQSPASSEVIQVTGVEANRTDNGVEVILQTTQGEQLQITNNSAENNFIADIPNAQLRLPSGDGFTFRSQKPVEGIAEITVTNLDTNTIRVTVTGETGLPTVELFDSNEGLIFGFTPAATAMQPEPEQPTSETPQEEPSAQGDDVIELVVTGQQDNYRVPDASSATRTDTRIRDIPASIQVVPRQVIEDRGVTNLAEALQNTSGTNGSSGATPTLRGFSTFDSVFVNGTRRGRLGFDNPTTDNVERIEVLKGPASVLFGQGSPGGIINLVTREPLSEPYYNFTFQAGSFEQIRPSFDISGPLDSEGTLLYRLIGSYERQRSFIEFANSETYFLAPSLAWRISPDTTFTVNLEFIDSSETETYGIPALGRGIANIPRSRVFAESGDFGDSFNKREIQRYNLSARFDHQFNQDWSIRNTSFFRTSTLRRALPNPAAFNEATGELQQRVFAGDEPFTSFFNNLDVVGNFTTGSINHKLLLGFEYGRENIFRRFLTGPAGSYPSINIFNPVYSNERFRFDTFPYNVQRDEFSTTYGFYLQDQISFTDNLILLLGGRYDIYEQQTINRISDVRRERTSNAFSPRVGIVYRPIEPLSLYGSFTRGFEPSSASLADGSAPPPLTATQYELGAKLDLGRLAATLAYFDITQTNRPTPDPTNPIFSVVTGEVKSRGVELDISGEVLPGWNIIAAYSYTDAFVSQDNNIPVGNRFVLTPRHSFSLWNTYEVQQGNLQGLGFGLGFYYVGEREGDIANSFALPSHLRTDASIFYRQNNWRAQLNFQNLFNTDYFVGGNQFRPQGAAPGAPFSIVGSVSFTF